VIDINAIMRRPIYEPKPRWCGGVFGYVAHRFPIRDGISVRDVLVRGNVNSLLQDMRRSRALIALLEKNRSEARQ
jgi:hypothetical protein